MISPIGFPKQMITAIGIKNSKGFNLHVKIMNNQDVEEIYIIFKTEKL